MNDVLEALKADLERFGKAHDATSKGACRMLNVTRETGQLLAVLVRATAARRVLEIGTSNGYSTLWLAEAAMALGGAVTTVEVDDDKVGLASANFARSGFSPFISVVHDDAARFLQRTGRDAYDFVFLDSERAQYCGWWPDISRILRAGGLLVVDNATSHTDEVAPLVTRVTADPLFATCTVPVGKGEFLAVKATALKPRST
jgi:predicted O-methyltransferase YrrM